MAPQPPRLSFLVRPCSVSKPYVIGIKVYSGHTEHFPDFGSQAPYYALWYPGPLAKEFRSKEMQPRYKHDPNKLSLRVSLCASNPRASLAPN